MNSWRMSFRVVGSVVFLSIVLAAHAAAAGPTIEVTSRVALEKRGGDVDQVAPRPGGGFVVRDYTWEPPAAQRIEIYDASGKRESRIEGYGHGPGKYVRLRDLAVDSDESIWIADFGASRITRFGIDGSVLGTLLLQNPSFRPLAVAVDPEARHLYAAGCVPIDTYLNRGCDLVHVYDLASRKHSRSLLRTPDSVVRDGWAGMGGYDLDVGPDGTVYFVHETVQSLFRMPADGKSFTEIPLGSEIASPPRPLERETATRQGGRDAQLAASYRVDRVVAAGGHVAVSIRRPGGQGYLLALFDDAGEPLGADVPAPGRLVGGTADGRWVFATRDGDRHVLLIGKLGSS